MSRTVIAAVVAVVIVALTAIAFFVTSSSFDQKQRNGRGGATRRARSQVRRPVYKQLEGIDVQNKAERLAALPEILAAVRTSRTASERGMQATKGFLSFNSSRQAAAERLASRHDHGLARQAKGQIIAMNDSRRTSSPKQWLDPYGQSRSTSWRSTRSSRSPSRTRTPSATA